MIALGVGVLLLVVFVKLRQRRRRKASLLLPLAGLDTGVRSAWRTPGPKLFRPHRGF